MSNVFKEVLSMSLSGALLILLIMIIKPLLKDRFTKAWQYYIWIIVLIRLLVPFSPEFGIVDNLFQSLSGSGITAIQPDKDTPAVQTGAGNQMDWPADNVEEDNPAAAQQNDGTQFPDLWELGSYLWLLGIVILFTIKLVRYLRFVKFIKNSGEPIAEKRILQVYKRAAEDLGIIKRPQLKRCSQITSPMLIGLLRPSIYLTGVTARWDDSSLYYVLRHELMHYKRQDLWYKWSSDLISCIHWFNPLVYVMCRFINTQCEISCDEAVARNFSPEEKIAYGNILLNAVSENLKKHQQALYSTLYEDKKSMKERIKSIIMSKQKSKKTKIFSIIVTLVLCAAAFWLGAYTMNGGNLNNGTKANAASGQTSVNGGSGNSADDPANQADSDSATNTGNTYEAQNSGTDSQSMENQNTNSQSTDGNQQSSESEANSTNSASDTSLNNADSQAGNENSASGNSNNSASDNSASDNSSSASVSSGISSSDNSAGDNDTANSSGGTSSNSEGTFIYSNTDFGFDFTLPSGWKGYTILKDTWQGTALSGKDAGKVTESGTKLIIRHPEWTEKVPRQDIPILVFTKDQWSKVEKEEIAVSAAPIGPSKLGSNSKYVFALPARYNFAFPAGFEEVEKIMEDNPLSANESLK